MTSSDHFAKWYASVTDDVRHHVVERGWYGREVSGNEMSQDVERSIDAHNSDVSRSAWGQLPEADQGSEAWEGVPNADLYGEPTASEHGFYGNTHAPGPASQDPYGSASGQTEASDLYGYDATQRAEMDDFYGSRDRPEPSPSDLYGEAPQSADASDFYGYNSGYEPEASDFYGQPEQDLEQEL